MRGTKIRQVADSDSTTQKKSELQMKLRSMVAACREANKEPSVLPNKENNPTKKLSHVDLRMRRAEAQAQVLFAQTTPLSTTFQDPVPPSQLVRGTNSLASTLDPLQSCYGGRTTVVAGPKGILTKSSSSRGSSKGQKPKRVTFDLDCRTLEPSPTPILATESEDIDNSSILPIMIEQKSLTQPVVKAPLFQPTARPARPSLSEQLSAIANKAGDLTADIRAKAGLPDPTQSIGRGDGPALFTSPAKNFTVGTLQCRYPSPAVFYRDRLEYVFHHPFQASEILLVLYYRDMQGLVLSPNPQPGKMYFRVPRKLVHFATDYDPSKHYVVLYLSSTLSFESVRNEIVPLIQGGGSVSSAGGGAGPSFGSSSSSHILPVRQSSGRNSLFKNES